MHSEIEQAIRIGKLLASYKLVDGASGNMSFKVGNKIVITKTGTNLDDLSRESFVEVDLDEENPYASSDLIVHKEVYKNTDYKAVLHCHGVYNVVLSFKFNEIKPLDLEGSLYFGSIRVVKGEFRSKELAKKIADAIREKGVVVVRGHGIYSAGENLREAFNKACYVEHSCEIIYKLNLLNKS